MNHVVLFAEDTGTANYLAVAPKILSDIGVASRVYSSEPGERQLSRLGIDCQKIVGLEHCRAIISNGPAMVIVGAGNNLDSFGLTLVELANQAGIETVGVVDQRQNLYERFRGHTSDPLYYKPN